MSMSALGIFIGVCPEWDDSRRTVKWLCVAFDKRGNWRSMTVHGCKSDAIKARAKLHRHHRNLKAEQWNRRREGNPRSPTRRGEEQAATKDRTMTHTLTDIAADIRKHSPGVLPESLYIEVGATERIWAKSSKGTFPLPDDIAEAVLRDAMTDDIAPHAVLIRTADAYRLDMLDGNRERWFHDSEHGGRTQALHAAWRKARGLTD